MHEAGHGLYAHGIAASLQRTPLATSPSYGVNESQSRTWENLVARSRPFWTHWYEPLQETFPDQLGAVSLDAFLAAVNRAEPGLIRVEADETTYSLHIILRFELEQRLIEGSLAPKDLPEAWNAGMKELLGVDVPDDANGVLQDTHWSSGGIGYFPTYALGNVISLQIWAVVREAIPDLDAQMEAGELTQLSAWLRENLYSLGRKLTPKETIERSPARPRSTRSRTSRTCARRSPPFPLVPEPLQLVVNGEPRTLEVEGRTLLVYALRDGLGLTGTHVGCDTSQCGACTVLVDGRAVKSCTMLALQAEGAAITTIEGLARGRRAASDPARVRRAARPPVRLLHAGDDPHCRQTCSRAIPTPTTTRSAARCAATTAAAPGTTPSSTRCARPRSALR